MDDLQLAANIYIVLFKHMHDALSMSSAFCITLL